MKNIIRFFLALSPIYLFGQWSTQNITLQPGWNSIYLEVEPVPKAANALFAGLPVKSVWAWAKQFHTKSENDLDWLIYNPNDPVLTDLHQLQGGKSYLIEIEGSESINLEITGKPILPSLSWQADTFSLAGFHIDDNNAPTFTDFFAAAPELLNNQVLIMDAAGNWTPVENLESTQIQKGTSYWIKCDRFSKFAAPISVHTEQENCLVFGSGLNSQNLRIQNNTDVDKTVTISAVPSTNRSDKLGEVALTVFDNQQNQWTSLSNTTIQLPASSEMNLAIGVDRNQMQNANGGFYQSLLEVKDGEGTQFFLPVSANGRNTDAGLWMGYAVIDKVSDVNGVDDAPVATASEFQLRLIVHVDDAGNAKLLDQVIQMWQEGTYKTDPNDPDKVVVDQAGQYVLITDDGLLNQFSGATIRDGKAVGRRMSSVHFGFEEPQALRGSFAESLTLDSLVLDYDDPLNPFKHNYHPDHNNLDERHENPLPEGKESYTIKRRIQLDFTADDPEGLNIAGFGDNMLGGIYQENISGIHRQMINISGKFRLRKVSSISRLNEVPPVTDLVRNGNPSIQIDLEEESQSQPSISPISVHPNPVIEGFYINGLTSGMYQISIWDIHGKLIRQGNIQDSDFIPTADLTAGVYTLKVNDGKQQYHAKFIKQSL